MACKFAKNFIFFPSIDGLVLCVYVCIMLASTHRRAGSGWRESSTCWFPRVFAPAPSSPRPSARPTRPTLLMYSISVIGGLDFGLGFVYFYIVEGARVHTVCARGHQSSGAAAANPLSTLQHQSAPHHASRRVRPPATIGRWLVVLAGVRAKKLLFFSCLDPWFWWRQAAE